MRKTLSLILALALILSCVCVSAKSDYDVAAERVKVLELLNTDLPNEPLLRGEGIYALMRMYARAYLPQTSEPCVFSDVEAGGELVPYANYAYEVGFVNGVGEGQLAPEESINLPQFIKIAVSVLGYKSVAEENGGYPDGYMSEAIRIGLLKGLSNAEGALTHKDAIILINNMLESYPLEPKWGENSFVHADKTLYEQMMNTSDLILVKGIVTAVEKAALTGEAALKEGEISVNSIRMSYPEADINALLGRQVLVHYLEGNNNRLPEVVSIHINERTNEEITVDTADSFIETLDTARLVYYDEKSSKEKLDFDALQAFYNGRSYNPALLTSAQAGELTALDNDGDGLYEILFIKEYASFIAERILSATSTVYLQDGYTFRGKNGIKFELDEQERQYEFYNENSEPVTFKDILPNDVISIWADMNEEQVTVKISRSVVEGKIEAKDDETVTVNGKQYTVYAPNRSEFMSKYDLGSSGKFGLNHIGEIVGLIGEIDSETRYGYVLSFGTAVGFEPACVKLISSGTREKEVEVEGNVETITYTYTNGEESVYEFADKVKHYDADGNLIGRIDSSNLTAGAVNRGMLAYTLNKDGKIDSFSVFTVPVYEVASLDISYAYKLNGELNSFGGYPDNPAFYVGDTTSVICVPQEGSPDRDDYDVAVPLVDKTQYIVIPIRIDSDTQIAECVAILADMDADDMSAFAADDEVSVLGGSRINLGADGNLIYSLDILTGEDLKTVFADEYTVQGRVARTLKKGDLIRYEANKNDIIKNIAFLFSLSDLGTNHFINNAGSANETVFGRITNIEYDRLDNQRNERVDRITLDVNGSEQPYIIKRKDGPMIYNYKRSTGTITSAIPEEITGSNQVGVYGASNVFMLVNENNPIVVINVIE